MIVSLIFIFALKIHFYVKMKRETISSDLNLNKYYPEHDPERHPRSFSRRYVRVI